MSKDDGTEEAKGGLLDETVQYHVQLKKGDISDFVILPGDPGRVEFIAEHFDKAELVAENREYKTMTGEYKGRPITVTSTGITLMVGNGHTNDSGRYYIYYAHA